MTRMRHDFAKFRALSCAQRRVLLKAAMLLPCFWAGLQVAGLRRLRAWLDQPRPAGTGTFSPEEIATLARMVNAGARLAPCPVTCLTRSRLLDWLLRRRGVPSELRIGVRLHRGTLDAHAWVEVDGVPVNDRKDIGSEYEKFANLPPPATFHSP